MGRLKSLANLDIYVNFDSAPGFIYTRPWAEDDHLPLKYTFHCFFSSNQLEDYSKQSLNQDSDPLVILSMSRKGSAQTVFPLSRDAVSSHLSDQQLTSRRKLTMLNRPESLLKLFDQLASNGIPTASARARSPSQLRSRRGIAKA
ncbi:hypothetical protein PCASD_23787 [Puccinia coronata f. sp. avenae]|uniref:Uncharacterized protein n=1 Tax=Puccinia coronata f. sp. avenae TaxID=200324 RepID=A0A2N5SZ48_9BASI|nr:hypothetical protein PCASD_23787 [Puccinia coronata f. sp. avenae]